MEFPTEYEQDIRKRSHLRDDKHAALCVLMDREMLVTYALTANEVNIFPIRYAPLMPNNPDHTPNTSPLHGQVPRSKRS